MDNLNENKVSPEFAPEFLPGRWVRLRSFVVLRWVAILGQIATIVIAHLWFSLAIPLTLMGLAIGASVALNIVSLMVFAKNARLNNQQATWMLLFDTMQLAVMVSLSGGLHNPFIVLILAPVTVAATALSDRAMIIVGGAGIAATTIIAYFYIPLRAQTGDLVLMPDLFVLGLWGAMVISVIFIGLYTRRIASEIRSVTEALLATQMALSREQKLTDLGGVIAAAAHELGTPLATIKLTAAELTHELGGQIDLQEDATLIVQQTDRCRDILQSMGQAGKDDMLIKTLPLIALVEEAAKPHMNRGKAIEINVNARAKINDEMPQVLRRAEIIHGLRNLIQNAVDYASTTVWIDVGWTDDNITLQIIDDGKGYSPQVIGWIGDPFIRAKKPMKDRGKRKEYKGLGLGLFIAKTLLERTGALLSFENGGGAHNGQQPLRIKTGAIAQVIWSRHVDGIEAKQNLNGLGDNRPFK